MTADPAALAQTLLQHIQRDPGDFEAWSTLLLLFVRAGDHGNVEGIVSARQNSQGDGLGFFYYVMRDVLALRQDALGTVILNRIAGNSVLFPVALYLRGLIACRQGHSDTAIDLIKQAAALIEHPAIVRFTARDRLFRDHAGQHIAAQAGFLEPAAAVLAAANPHVPPPIAFTGDAAPPGSSLIAAACDRGYFQRFARPLIASVAALGDAAGLHLHVIAPDDGTDAQIAALTASHPFLRISTEAGSHDSTYYACSRFLIAPALLDRYRRPLVAIDVDVTVAKPLDGVTAALGHRDIGWCEVRDKVPVPSLICDARLVAINPTEGAARFLGVLGAYLDRMLATGARWMVDQAGLYCVSRALGAGVDLAPRLGPNYGGLIVPAGALDEKLALRAGGSVTP